MWGHVHIIWDSLIGIIILTWMIYSIGVIIYLNYITHKYLIPVSRDEEVGNKRLKTHEDMLEKYKDREEINILILGGGGVRGMVPLHILTHIESITGKKTGEIFDFIAGSSTGAISAAGLSVDDGNGGYKVSAKNLLDRYSDNIRRMFSSPIYHQLFTLFGMFAPRYLPKNKIEVLDEYMGGLTIGELRGNILIPVYNLDQNKLEIVKNWVADPQKVNLNFMATDLINGASNPPMIFCPNAFELNERKYLWIDPAVILNNPILHVLLYVRGLFPHKKLNLVLIGNGSTNNSKYNYRYMFSFGLYGLYQYLFNAPTLNTKLYVEFVEDYLVDANSVDRQLEFFRINSTPDEYLSASDTSKANLDKITKFANKMLGENLVQINEMIKVLIKEKE